MDSNLHKEHNIQDITEKIKRQEHGRRRKASIRRQKARRRNVCIALIIILILLIFITAKISSCVREYRNNKPKTETTASAENTNNSSNETPAKKKVEYTIEAPRIRKKAEVYRILKQYAQKDEKMKQLYNDRKLYKVSLLNKVINNPEMTDFVLGYNDAEDRVWGGISDKEINEDFPLLIQWDKRWAYKSYGDSNIGLAGCAPTCLSMVIFSLTRNEAATPYAIAQYSDENDYYVDGIGTAWALMQDVPGQYGVLSKEIRKSEENFKAELDNERMLICGDREILQPGDIS